MFVQVQAELFPKNVMKIEGDDVTAIEVAKSLNGLEESLKMRKQDDFSSPTTVAEKQRLIDDEYNSDEMAAIRNDLFGNVFACFCIALQLFDTNFQTLSSMDSII